MICKDNRAVAQSCFPPALCFISSAILVFLRLHSVPLRHIMLFGSIGWCRHLRETAGLLESVCWSAAAATAAVWSVRKLVWRRRAMVSGRRWVVWESLLQRGIPHNSLGFSHCYSKDHSVCNVSLTSTVNILLLIPLDSHKQKFKYLICVLLCSVTLQLCQYLTRLKRVCVDKVVWGNVSEATN